MRRLTEFLRQEEGAVTIEWVALAAGVVLLAIGVIIVLGDPVTGVASAISTQLAVVVDEVMATATDTAN